MLKPKRGRKIGAAGRSGWRRVSLAGLSAVVLVSSLTATARALGELTQKPGTAAASPKGGSGGCQPGIGLFGAFSVATSSDGKSVYVASAGSDAVAIFNRNPDGTLEQLPDTAGCIAQDKSGGCQPGKGLDRASSVAISPDGKNVYVASTLSEVKVTIKSNGCIWRVVEIGDDTESYMVLAPSLFRARRAALRLISESSGG